MKFVQDDNLYEMLRNNIKPDSTTSGKIRDILTNKISVIEMDIDECEEGTGVGDDRIEELLNEKYHYEEIVILLSFQ